MSNVRLREIVGYWLWCWLMLPFGSLLLKGGFEFI